MMPETIMTVLRPRSGAAAAARTQAFADLYTAQFDRVYRYFCYRLDDPALAEDMTAEVFVRAWSKLGDLSGGDASLAWLFATARHLIADHYRARRPTLPLAALPPADHPAGEPPDDGVVATEQRVLVARCLAELSEREREIIALRFAAGLRHAQISQVVGVSEGNVAKILHRALRKLRARLQGEEEHHA